MSSYNSAFQYIIIVYRLIVMVFYMATNQFNSIFEKVICMCNILRLNNNNNSFIQIKDKINISPQAHVHLFYVDVHSFFFASKCIYKQLSTGLEHIYFLFSHYALSICCFFYFNSYTSIVYQSSSFTLFLLWFLTIYIYDIYFCSLSFNAFNILNKHKYIILK